MTNADGGTLYPADDLHPIAGTKGPDLGLTGKAGPWPTTLGRLKLDGECISHPIDVVRNVGKFEPCGADWYTKSALDVDVSHDPSPSVIASIEGGDASVCPAV
ncbi:MAG: hypothetical protein M1557_07375 [Actinobacteria bacterium]|nr:hypothetical protein [Actinomycetota bacterium]